MIQFQQAPAVPPKNDLTKALESRKKVQDELANELASASSNLSSGIFLTIMAGVSVFVTVGALNAFYGTAFGDTEALRELSRNANAFAVFFGAGFTILTSIGSSRCWFDLAKHRRQVKELESELEGSDR